MLEVRSLAARRGGRKVFRDVSFTLGAGAALMLRGGNGSGKSSLLRALAGLIAPDDGRIYWNGDAVDTAGVEHRTRLCFIGHLDALKPELTVMETLTYWRALGGRGSLQVSADILQPFGLEGMGQKSVRALSAGQRRRLGLTRLHLNHVPLWLLDEPATALDRDAQALLADALARHRAAGGMAVVATHHDEDAPGAKVLSMGIDVPARKGSGA